jgi:hypothetical protein
MLFVSLYNNKFHTAEEFHVIPNRCKNVWISGQNDSPLASVWAARIWLVHGTSYLSIFVVANCSQVLMVQLYVFPSS